MLLTLLYLAILLSGVALLLVSASNIQERGTLALIGLGMVLTQASLLSGGMRSTGGLVVFTVGAMAGLMGSLKLLKNARRQRVLHRP